MHQLLTMSGFFGFGIACLVSLLAGAVGPGLAFLLMSVLCLFWRIAPEI